MMLFSAFRAVFKQGDYTAKDIEPTIKATSGAREVVFTTIESLVIITGLEIALSKQGAIWLWMIYIVAWLSLTLYLVTYARYVINLVAERLELTHRNRNVFLWTAGILSVTASCVVTNGLPAVTAAFITTNFMK